MNGAAYEARIRKNIEDSINHNQHNPLLHISLLPSSNTNSNKGIDLPLMFHGKPLYIELKMANAQMSGTSLHYDRDTGTFTMVKPMEDSDILIEAASVKRECINAYIDTLKKEEPLSFHENIRGFPLKATTIARDKLKMGGLQKIVATEFIHPITFLREFHNKKGIYYIQIEGKGFFSLGGNPFNLPIPELDGSFQIEFRIGYGGAKINVPQDNSLSARSAGLRIQGRLLTSNISPYSLDNLEDIQRLFSSV